MNKTLTKDARGFVEGVVTYLRHDGRSKGAIPKVQALLGKVTAQAKKERVANVKASVTLSSAEKTALSHILAKFIGHPVQLECHVHPELLGGVRIQVADWVVDTSIVTQIDRMAETLLQ